MFGLANVFILFEITNKFNEGGNVGSGGEKKESNPRRIALPRLCFRKD